MGEKDEGLANASLNTSRVPAEDTDRRKRPPDPMPSTRTLPGNDHQKGLDETQGSSGGERKP